ncbi:MAG: hypothetical protein RBG13Loki_2850 [Promethearchaeota archaeon CR_4]|nr:MAG: hypothetical protein RBG13Loki_2850 [Candidatus Lokiarchaeota archaeon CR_4]
MPTIHMYGEVGGNSSGGNLTVFLALCARIGAKGCSPRGKVTKTTFSPLAAASSSIIA